MKVLALDFDGVIADSQLECLVVGFNSYLKLHKNTKLFDGKKITFENLNKVGIKHKKTINGYKRLRPYVIDAFCYYVIAYIIENYIKIRNQNHYNTIRKKLMKDYHKKYVHYFYNERYSLQEKDINKWLELEAPFKNIIDAVKKLEKNFIITIATNNNKKSIDGFLKKYNLRPKIIADSGISVNKKKQLSHIKNRLKANYKDIHFVDDQAKHFPKLLKLGIHCYLALWGYNNKKQQEEAKKSGVVLLNKNNFYRTFAK